MFTIAMNVRDYECDMQGIVNNAVYQNYLEHARHEFLISKVSSFKDMVQQGVYAVIVRIEIDYLHSLQSGDQFEVSVSVMQASRLRLLFEQSIVMGEKKVAHANVYVVLRNAQGKLQRVDAWYESLSAIV